MGLKDSALLADSNADGGGKAVSLSCSICLDVVTNSGERSWAKLQCGHQFHLDCIGSAFNMKGAMQCPNCRKTEHGQWLYASGCRQFPEFSMDEWAHNEDLFDLSFPEMSLGVHWCPIRGLTRLPSSLEEAGFLSNSYRDLAGQRAVLSEHTAVSSASTSHPCPYIAYFGPIQPPSSYSGGSVSDGSSFYNHWNGSQVPSWEHHFSPFPISSGRGSVGGQSSNPPVAQRVTRLSSVERRSGSILHPSFLVAPSSAARGRIPVVSSMIPPYPGSVDRSRDRVQALQAYFQPPSSLPSTHVAWRSSSQVGPSSSSDGQFLEAGNHFQPWERDHLTSFLLRHQHNRERVWCSFQHNAVGGSDTGIRSAGFRHRQGYYSHNQS